MVIRDMRVHKVANQIATKQTLSKQRNVLMSYHLGTIRVPRSGIKANEFKVVLT